MLNIIKIPMILLVFTFLMPLGSTMSYAWGGHSGGGGYHGSGGRGYGRFGGRGYRGYGNFNSYFGLGYNYWPYNYYYDPGYYDTGVLVSSPVVETPEIVEQPFATVVSTTPTDQATEITPVQTTTEMDNEITINIPNSAGGYTSVLMKRSGNGFVGPQGEFYPEFPKVSALKVIYGK